MEEREDNKERTIKRETLSDLAKGELIGIIKDKNTKIRRLVSEKQAKQARIQELERTIREINRKYNDAMQSITGPKKY